MKNIDSLKNSSEFGNVYKNGKSFANGILVMYVMPTEGELRLGISVSKKVGNSVVRHRSTRLIRESFISCKGEIKKGCHIVTVARVGIREKKQTEVEAAFRNLLKRHKLV